MTWKMTPIEARFRDGLSAVVRQYGFSLRDFTPAVEAGWKLRVTEPKSALNPLMGDACKWDRAGEAPFVEIDGDGNAALSLVPQARVKRYWPDFMVDMSHGMTHCRLFVECDGHDFHERTKDQAMHDRRRDRWFALNQLTVLRFTGRELTRDSMDCAKQVIGHLKLMCEKEWERLLSTKLPDEGGG